MRSNSSRSAVDLAFAANKPQAAASRRCFDALDGSCGWCASDIALSSWYRRERNRLSAIGAWVRPLATSRADDRESIHPFDRLT